MQTNKTNLIRAIVPAYFWDDHCDRCPCDGDPDIEMAREIKRAGNRVTIEGTVRQIEVLRSDATYYTDPWGPDGDDLGPLKASAKRTLFAIAKAFNQS